MRSSLICIIYVTAAAALAPPPIFSRAAASVLATAPHLSRRAVVLGTPVALAVANAPAVVAAEEDNAIAVTVLENGDVSTPTAERGQVAVVDYTLWLNDFGGQRVDGNRGFSFKVGVGQVIAGWDKTVGEMHVGERRRVVIPAALGYGTNGIGPIPGGASLYFDIQLRELKPTKEQLAAQAEAAAAARSPAEQSKLDRQAMLKKVRAERMEEEARRQNAEYVRIQSAVGTRSFGSTVSVR